MSAAASGTVRIVRRALAALAAAALAAAVVVAYLTLPGPADVALERVEPDPDDPTVVELAWVAEVDCAQDGERVEVVDQTDRRVVVELRVLECRGARPTRVDPVRGTAEVRLDDPLADRSVDLVAPDRR